MSTGSGSAEGNAVAAPALTSLADARARLLARLAPVAPRGVPMAQAAGRVLAADVVVPSDVPAAGLALRAGLAVAALDTVGAGPFSPAILPSAPLSTAAGDPLPPGCDALLPQDAVEMQGPYATALAVAAPGDGVRRAGEDAGAGDALAAEGTRLTSTAVAAASACGVSEALCRVPRLRIVSGGAAAAASAAGLVALLAAEAGAEAVTQGHADLLVAVGDVGTDRSALDLAGVALRPGGDGLSLGTVGGVPAVFVQGRPEAALAAWLGILEPAVARLSGARAGASLVEVELAGKAASTPGFADLVLLRTAGTGPWEVLAVGDVSWSRLAVGAAAALIPAESEGVPAGGRLPARPL